MIEWREGDKVRVAMANGTIVEGKVAHLFKSWGIYVGGMFCQIADEDGALCVSKVEVIPDFEAGMERITDIKQVQVGDIAVYPSMRGHVKQIQETYMTRRKLFVAFDPEEIVVWMPDKAFQYALRPKPALPEEPGFYRVDDAGTVLVHSATDDWEYVVKDGRPFIPSEEHGDGLSLDALRSFSFFEPFELVPKTD